jgi:hypothetical protein
MDIVTPMTVSDTDGNIVISRLALEPLGVRDHVTVYLMLTEPGSDRPGEILFSPLDLSRWRNHIKIEVRSTFSNKGPFFDTTLPSDWGIALLDSFCFDGRTWFQSAVFIDKSERPFSERPDRLAELVQRFASNENDVKVAPFASLGVTAWWNTSSIFEKGQFVLKTDGSFESWKRLIRAQLSLFDGQDVFDNGRFVVSLDTESRTGRIVFPKKGTHSVNIEFEDKPGALGDVCSELRNQGLGILKSFVKRACDSRQVLVATVEPSSDIHSNPRPSPPEVNLPPCIFISHPHKDWKLAVNLYSLIDHAFAGRLKIVCTSLSVSSRSVPEDDLFHFLGQQIRSSNLLLLLVTSNTPTRAVVAWELVYAEKRGVQIVLCMVPSLPDYIAEEVRQQVGAQSEFMLGAAEQETMLIKLISQETGLQSL